MQIQAEFPRARPVKPDNTPINIQVLNWVAVWTLQYSIQKWNIEAKNEIKFVIMESLIHPWQERLRCFDCNNQLTDTTWLISKTCFEQHVEHYLH